MADSARERRSGGTGTRHRPAARSSDHRPALVQADWMPLQICSLVNAPASITTLTLDLVMTAGVSSTDGMVRPFTGSLREPVASELAFAVSPLISAIASAEAAWASLRTSLKIVRHWSPVRMYWM